MRTGMKHSGVARSVSGLIFVGASLLACTKPDNGPRPAPSATVAPVTATASAPNPSGDGMLEKQTQWLRAFAEAFNKHDAAALSGLYSPDAVFVELGTEGGEAKGTAAITSDYRTLFDGFADVKWTVTRSWHMGNVVALEFVEGGTGTGEDDKPRPFGYVGASLIWFDANGQVTRDQSYYDDLTMEVQLGWVKPPISKIPVRPVREVPPFTGTWEQHVATGTPDEAKILGVREKLYSKLLTPGAEKEFLEIVTDDIVVAEYDDPFDAVGKKGVAENFKDWHKTFSNMKIEATHAWPCGEFVIFEGTFAGKLTGTWGPLPPSNKEFGSHFLDVTRIAKDGRVDRLWTYASSSEILGLRRGTTK